MRIIKQHNIAEHPQSPHRFWSWKKFFLFVCALLVACILAVAVLVAKTGLVRVPLIGSFVETAPPPSRIVRTTSTTPSLEKTIEKEMQRTRGAANEQAKLKFELSEATLTDAFMRLAPIAARDFPRPLEVLAAQVASEEGAIEAYLRVRYDDRSVALQVRLAPTLVNGVPEITIQSVRLGSLSLPIAPLQAILDARVKEVLKATGEYGSLRKLEVHPGNIIIEYARP